ncbi:MAG: SGNH/GDSL hydrolase family protein [Acidimicrobiia bacterium]|nr:SGNH/GDSL hydrolase family protein [Acidimicrobiia bacterium]
MGWRAVLIAAGALLLAVLAGCQLVEEEYSGDPDGPKVSVIGDSITVLAADEIHGAMDDAYQTRIAARTGYTWRRMLDDAEEHAATDPEVAVVNLGTNDVSTSEPIPRPELFADVERLLGVYEEDTCLVLVTVYDDAVKDDYDNEKATLLNARMKAWADVVVDWDAAVSEDPTR